MNLEKHLRTSFEAGRQAIDDFLANEANIQLTADFAAVIASAFQNDKKVLICGNGGSACDAAHFAEEFTGRFRGDRKALPVIAINDGGHLTCVANDYGFEEVFARSVEAFAQEGDIVIGISTSGNSENVIRALDKAKVQGAKTFSLIGREGGRMKGAYDYELVAPGLTTDRIQEIHMIFLHILIEGVERILFPENYA